METVGRWQAIPEIRFISSYCDLPEFIDGFVALGRKYDPSKYDHVLFSFHGLPERQIRKADDHGHCLKDNCCAELGPRNANCYRAQCFQTARKIAAGLGLSFEQYTVCFQSRLGKDPWVRPYSDDIIRERAKRRQTLTGVCSGIHERLPGNHSRDRRGVRRIVPRTRRREDPVGGEFE